MAVDDDSRAGEGMAIDWIAGRSEMSDDLALLVSGMEQPLDETARAFLITIGNAARAAAKRAELAVRGAPRPTPTGAPSPAVLEGRTPAAPPAIDVDSFWRQTQERMQRARIEEFWRKNSEIPAIIDMRPRRRPGDDLS